MLLLLIRLRQIPVAPNAAVRLLANLEGEMRDKAKQGRGPSNQTTMYKKKQAHPQEMPGCRMSSSQGYVE